MISVTNISKIRIPKVLRVSTVTTVSNVLMMVMRNLFFSGNIIPFLFELTCSEEELQER